MRTEREKRNFKKSIGFIACFLVLTAALVLGSRIEARADGLMGVTNLRQTDSSQSSATFEWDADLSAQGYAYQVSNDGSAWSTERYASLGATIDHLNSGKSYYVRVRSYDKAKYGYAPYGPKNDAVFSDWSAPLEIVTCPETMKASQIKQTGATVSTIDMKWEPVEGATYYSVSYEMGGSEFRAGVATGTSFTITGLDPDTCYEVYVHPSRESGTGYRSGGFCEYGSNKYTATAKVKNLKLSRWETGGNRIYLYWDNDFRNITGYEVYVTSLSGKKVKRFKCVQRGEDFSVSSLKNKGFIYRVRTYKDVDGTTIYGAWSAKKVVIAQPGVQLKRKNSRTIQLTWSKVPGAAGYTVYRSTSPYSGYQKIKTTKATKLTNTGLSDTRYYYYYVVANKVKVGKKTYKTTAALEREIAYLNWQGSTEYDYMR